jgi:hypothetical protein
VITPSCIPVSALVNVVIIVLTDRVMVTTVRILCIHLFLVHITSQEDLLDRLVDFAELLYKVVD